MLKKKLWGRTYVIAVCCGNMVCILMISLKLIYLALKGAKLASLVSSSNFKNGSHRHSIFLSALFKIELILLLFFSIHNSMEPHVNYITYTYF